MVIKVTLVIYVLSVIIGSIGYIRNIGQISSTGKIVICLLILVKSLIYVTFCNTYNIENKHR